MATVFAFFSRPLRTMPIRRSLVGPVTAGETTSFDGCAAKFDADSFIVTVRPK